jgi:predicted RNA binding protein YcfA (HicA-like mRNA interferase family)
VLEKAGFHFKRRQPHGPSPDNPFSPVVVPDYKELDPGTLRAIIRQAGMGIDEFARLL